MKLPVLLAVCGTLAAALPAVAQNPAASPATLYPDSPARANPRPGAAPKRSVTPDEGKRGPRGPLDWERTAALSPNGELFVTANLDGHWRVWETVSGKSTVDLPAGVVAAVFSPDSRLLACRFEGTAGRYWQVFTAGDGQPAGQPLTNADEGGTEALFFSPDGKRLAGFVGAGANTGVALWDAAGGKAMATQPVKELSGGGGTLVFSPDGKILAAVGSGTGAVLLPVPDLKPPRTIPFEQKALGTAAFSPDGRLLAVGGDEQRTVKGKPSGYPTAALYDVATGKLVAELKVAANAAAQVRQVVFTSGGRAVVTGTDENAQAWSTADGRLQANLPGGGFPLAVSPDGKLLAGSGFPEVRCWDTTAWRLGLKIANARAGYGTGTGRLGYVPLAFIQDGSGIVTVRGNSVAAWELPGGRQVIEHDATQTLDVY